MPPPLDPKVAKKPYQQSHVAVSVTGSDVVTNSANQLSRHGTHVPSLHQMLFEKSMSLSQDKFRLSFTTLVMQDKVWTRSANRLKQSKKSLPPGSESLSFPSSVNLDTTASAFPLGRRPSQFRPRRSQLRNAPDKWKSNSWDAVDPHPIAQNTQTPDLMSCHSLPGEKLVVSDMAKNSPHASETQSGSFPSANLHEYIIPGNVIKSSHMLHSKVSIQPPTQVTSRPSTIDYQYKFTSSEGIAILNQGSNHLDAFTQYGTFSVILLVALLTKSWADVTPSTLIFFILISWYYSQVSRLFRRYHNFAMAQPYLSTFIYFLTGLQMNLNVYSVLLWQSFQFMTVFQIGHGDTRKHAALSSLLLYACHLGAYFIRSTSRSNHCPTVSAGTSLVQYFMQTPLQDIPWGCSNSEPVLISSIDVMAWLLVIPVIVNYHELGRVVHAMTKFVLQISNFGAPPRPSNAKKSKNHEETTPNVDAPITRVIELLKVVRAQQEGTNPSALPAIDTVTSLLASKHLFAPNLDKTEVDRQVQDFLDFVLLSGGEDKRNDIEGLYSPGSLFSVVDPEFEVTSVEHDSVSSGLNAAKNDPSYKDAVLYMRDHLGTSSCNAIFLNEISGRPLFHTCMSTFKRLDLCARLSISENRLARFATKVEENYYNVPYHNAVHAADVSMFFFHFLCMPEIDETLTDEEKLSCIVASMVHDMRHPGLNNLYLINTRHPLAIRYNDSAVLENYHCASAFEILDMDECNIFNSFTDDGKKLVRDHMINMVLATDMTLHFEYVGKFKAKFSSGAGLDSEVKGDRQLLMAMLMKASDINNATKPFRLYETWSYQILEEFFRQGDDEKLKGHEVSAFMNRETTEIPKCQTSFVDFVVLPLFETLSLGLGDYIDPLLQSIRRNREEFAKHQEAGVMPGITNDCLPNRIEKYENFLERRRFKHRASRLPSVPCSHPPSARPKTPEDAGGSGSQSDDMARLPLPPSKPPTRSGSTRTSRHNSYIVNSFSNMHLSKSTCGSEGTMEGSLGQMATPELAVSTPPDKIEVRPLSPSTRPTLFSQTNIARSEEDETEQGENEHDPYPRQHGT